MKEYKKYRSYIYYNYDWKVKQ